MNIQTNNIINFVNSSNENIILLLPIGPPGSGKTTLRDSIIDEVNRNVITVNRDEIFKKYRDTNSIRKSKQLTHKEIKDTISNPKNNTVVYIDTVNSNHGIRKIYHDIVKPNIIKYICFKTTHLLDPIDYLINRTISRIHPTFPKERHEQEKIIQTIINLIEYPTDNCINIFI